MPYVYKEPGVVETHETVVERDGSSGAIIGIVLAALLVLGFIGYFAFMRPSEVQDSGRAQTINVTSPDVKAPDVNIKAPDVNVTTPAPIINNPPAAPPVTTTTGGTSEGTSDPN